MSSASLRYYISRMSILIFLSKHTHTHITHLTLSKLYKVLILGSVKCVSTQFVSFLNTNTCRINIPPTMSHSTYYGHERKINRIQKGNSIQWAINRRAHTSYACGTYYMIGYSNSVRRSNCLNDLAKIIKDYSRIIESDISTIVWIPFGTIFQSNYKLLW